MNKAIILIIVLSFFSCGGNGVERPEKLLSEDEMVNALYDLSLLQAMNSTASAQLDSARVDAKNYIYKKYSIDSATWIQNQKYYAADMEKYQKLHKKVSEKMTAEKAPLDSVTKPDPSSKKKLIRKAAGSLAQ